MQLGELLETLACAVVLRDAEGRFVYVNRLAREFFGPLDVAGSPFLFVREDGQPLMEADTGITVLRTGRPLQNNVVGVVCDGKVKRWLRSDAAPLMDAAGRVVGVAGSAIDVTELHDAEERARIAAERWRRLVAESPNAILTVDISGRALSWNPSAERMFGWTEGQVLGRALTWVPQAQRAAYLEQLRRVGQTGRTEAIVAEQRTQDGRHIPVHGSVARLETPAGQDGLPEFILTYTDMSVHAQVEAQARELALMHERQRIAMDLHDGVIQSLYAICLSLSTKGRREPPDYDATLAHVSAAIGDIIRDIRTYIFNLRPGGSGEQTLAGGLHLLAEDLRATGSISVQVVAEESVAFELSPERAAELLQIAREATSNVARHAGATSVELRLEHAGGLVTLSVRDNGKGFDPLSRASRRGDGIANMQSRARAVGGSMHIMSSEGKGTLVQVELPLAEISLESHRQVARVLVVDDHQLVRLGLTLTLADAPGLVIAGEAGSMKEAVERARELKPDLVLMDVRLSDGSGIDACRLIRSERPATRVVMLTSFADDDAVLSSVLAGASGYLLKQDHPAQLISSLARVAAGESLLTPDSVRSVMRLLRRGDPEADIDPFLRLTPQEGKVLRLVTKGKTNREIARTLGLSEHTVRTYLSNIFGKLHIARRAEAAALAARRVSRDPPSAASRGLLAGADPGTT